jgi:hypothetical protein
MRTADPFRLLRRSLTDRDKAISDDGTAFTRAWRDLAADVLGPVLQDAGNELAESHGVHTRALGSALRLFVAPQRRQRHLEFLPDFASCRVTIRRQYGPGSESCEETIHRVEELTAERVEEIACDFLRRVL